MAVKIRLLRMGRKKKPFYRIVAIDTKSRRDGRYLDKVGYYDPLTKPATVKIDKEKVLDWLEKGAIPSDTVFNLLQKEGIALEWHLIRNKVSDQARNIEIQKWELSRKQSAEAVEVEEKPQKTTGKKTKAVKATEEEASPETEAPEETSAVSEEEVPEIEPELAEAQSEDSIKEEKESEPETSEEVTKEEEPESSQEETEESQPKD
ncbi:MAG: 30S ribosomal protein S16 [Candidatus Marinimicrobia bacterium]|nr:30S ribosomal protein S16 [Candidatus Neomarinimicrobiota bacterium]MCK9560777.1 30S ribosomal protein S16 [Candidatus Neomarinimicrobiota bacterium]MDD5539286.1 30S ribosomal protein S16 [Candidatus Neomarinimicrobiota bacterium]